MACRISRVGLIVLALFGQAVALHAQPVDRGTERIDASRPEAWAMQYFASTTLLGGFTVPISREPGSILVGAEIVWVPLLSADKQRVGFNGTKPEDLNKAPFVPRPRIVIALPAAFTTTVAFVPPIETFGIDPKLVAVAVERPIYQSPTWAMGWRVYGQIGTAKAAFTCPEEAVAFAPGSAQNVWGCLETSSDVATLRYIGFELGLGQSTAGRFVTPHAAVAVNYFQNGFEVNARRLDVFNRARQEFIDRTIQKSRATTFSLTGGVGFRLAARVEGVVDLFYTPLWVSREAGQTRQNDGLFTAKALLTYKLR
jgi:hypothetical protein